MNPESDRDEMRPEYDVRGGVRGKYYERYRQVVVMTESPLVWRSTSGTPDVGRLTHAAVYPPASPSPRIQVGSPTTP